MRVLGWTVVVFVMGTAAWVASQLATLPGVSDLATDAPTETAFMRAHGATEPIEWTPLDRISPLLACAVVRAEDDRFFEHHGIDWTAAWDAALRDLRGERLRGASTITQQLARNLFLGPERTVQRKLREAMLTRRLEHALGKRRILELYLNVIEWGPGVFGVVPATRHYLDESPDRPGAFEASFLASLIAAPTTPLVGRNLQRAAAVQQRVLLGLHASGLIDAEELRRAHYGALFLFQMLRRESPLPAALQVARDRMAGAPPAGQLPVIEQWRRVPLADALASGCGSQNHARWWPQLAPAEDDESRR
ncbi:MAG TPA: biosynthetic peptidoglycan transglycosylase [Candidatus Eisenbacteria bacterium]|nr:biosynthetic peptidoglycan transglycosylase [Candidatus Eisenbacteria bacterium]